MGGFEVRVEDCPELFLSVNRPSLDRLGGWESTTVATTLVVSISTSITFTAPSRKRRLNAVVTRLEHLELWSRSVRVTRTLPTTRSPHKHRLDPTHPTHKSVRRAGFQALRIWVGRWGPRLGYKGPTESVVMKPSILERAPRREVAGSRAARILTRSGHVCSIWTGVKADAAERVWLLPVFSQHQLEGEGWVGDRRLPAPLSGGQIDVECRPRAGDLGVNNECGFGVAQHSGCRERWW